MSAVSVKPIRNKEDLNAALKRVEAVFFAKPGTPEYDEMEVLSALIRVYEEEHYPALPPDPIEAIRFHMDQHGLSPRDLIPCIGGRSRVYEVLSRRRALTMEMVRKLHSMLGIPIESLTSAYDLVPPKPREKGTKAAHQGGYAGKAVLLKARGSVYEA